MPSVRSLIQIAVLIAVLCLIAVWLSLFQTPDSGGMGRDTYGTREAGYRAIFETLGELGVEVDRQLRPPHPAPENRTIAFLNPDPQIAGVEPRYLKNLLPWVEGGGRLVVAVRAATPLDLKLSQLSQSPTELPTILETLGLKGVKFERANHEAEFQKLQQEHDEEDDFSKSFLKELNRELVPPRVVVVDCTGTLADWQKDVSELALPGDAEQTLVWEKTEPAGQISYFTEDGEERIVAAEFPRGKGAILVVDEGLFRNRLLPQQDNSVAAAYLLSPRGEPVVFDEFYHGLGVRGNPFFLLTLPGYAAIALGLLLWIGLDSWRKASLLGPPLPDEPHSRRDIGEYISAMGRLFAKGAKARAFLIRQIRAGVLRELNTGYALPPETQDVDLVANLIERRNPARARQLREAVAEADRLAEWPGRLTEAQTLDAMRRLAACL